jgi:hypothetical protein
MADPQITIRVDQATKTAFEAYARKLDLKESELAKLLLVRERFCRRLAALHAAGQTPVRPRRAPGEAEGPLPTVTAHLSSKKAVEAFDAYTAACGLNRSTGGAWLLEKEISERWLEHALKSELAR